jgi:hypothetical protein
MLTNMNLFRIPAKPRAYANTNLTTIARKPLPIGRLKTCTELIVVNRFRENEQ